MEVHKPNHPPTDFCFPKTKIDNTHVKHNGSNSSRGCIMMKGKRALITFHARFGLICFIAFAVLTFSLNYFYYYCCDFLKGKFLFFRNDFVLYFYGHTQEKQRNLRDQTNKDSKLTHISPDVFCCGRKRQNVFIVIRAHRAIEVPPRTT